MKEIIIKKVEDIRSVLERFNAKDVESFSLTGGDIKIFLVTRCYFSSLLEGTFFKMAHLFMDHNDEDEFFYFMDTFGNQWHESSYIFIEDIEDKELKSYMQSIFDEIKEILDRDDSVVEDTTSKKDLLNTYLSLLNKTWEESLSKAEEEERD